MKIRFSCLAAAGVAAIGAIVAMPINATATTQTKVGLVVNELTTSFTYLHAGKPSEGPDGPAAPGDQIVFQSKLVVKQKSVGHGSVSCTFTGSSQASTVCTGVYTLPKGSVTFAGQGGQGVLHLPIVGGTGSYVGAHGVLTVKDVSESLSHDTFAFVVG